MKNLKYLFILIIIFFLFVINLNSKKITYNYVLEPRCIYNIEKFNKIKEEIEKAQDNKRKEENTKLNDKLNELNTK